MNPYLSEENKLALRILDETLNSNNKLISSMKERNDELQDLRLEIKRSCTHKDKEGNSTWEYTGQDPGSGKSEHRCTICGSSD